MDQRLVYPMCYSNIHPIRFSNIPHAFSRNSISSHMVTLKNPKIIFEITVNIYIFN